MTSKTTPPAPNHLETLLSHPTIGAMIGVDQSIAKAAVAARAERADATKALAIALTANHTRGSGQTSPSATSTTGAAPIIRAPWHPMHPVEDGNYTAPADFLTTLTVHARANRAVLLTGPAGTGKTEAVALIASRLGRPMIKIDCSPVRDASDWWGSPTIVDGRIAWQDSALVTAIETDGAIILLDEINRASRYALNGLLGALDGTRTVCFPARSEPVRVAEVMIFATANVGMQFQGTGAIDAALRDRFTTVPTDYLTVEEEIALLIKKCEVTHAHAHAIASIAAFTRSAEFGRVQGLAISTRKSILTAEMIQAYISANASPALAIRSLVTHQPDESMGSLQTPRSVLAAHIVKMHPALA